MTTLTDSVVFLVCSPNQAESSSCAIVIVWYHTGIDHKQNKWHVRARPPEFMLNRMSGKEKKEKEFEAFVAENNDESEACRAIRVNQLSCNSQFYEIEL